MDTLREHLAKAGRIAQAKRTPEEKKAHALKMATARWGAYRAQKGNGLAVGEKVNAKGTEG